MTARHGMSNKTRFHKTWIAMRQRCTNPRDKSFKDYGAKGITVYERWNEFENFMYDMYESYLEHCKLNGENNTSIERKDNSKGYSKENCQWATAKVQARNRSSNKRFTYNGENLTLVEFSEKYNSKYMVLHSRIFRLGWSIEKAIETPVRKCGARHGK